MGTNLILLTAAVTPEASFASSLADPEERLRQYEAAIVCWTKIAYDTGCSLGVVETTASGHLLGDVARVLDFTPSEAARERGKGAVEAEALDAALRAFDMDGDSTLHKVTGRLMLRNAAALVRPLPTGVATVRRTLDRSYCDTRFFSASYDVWQKYLTGMAEEVNDSGGRYLEHVMAHRLIEAEYQGVMVERFAERPLILGASGTTGKAYGTPRQRLVSPIKKKIEDLLVTRALLKQF